MKPRDERYFHGEECKPFLHHGGDTGVVLLHGFTGSVAHMRPLGDALHQRGYTAMGINLPGHATIESDMARCGRREWLQAALDAVAFLRLQCGKVAVCGLSMGAVLSMIVSEKQKADACISISAPLPPQNRLLPLSGVMGYLMPRVAWKEDENRKNQLDIRYDKGYSGFPMRNGADLYSLAKQAQKDLQFITCPMLVIQSLDDHAVSPSSADTIVNGISSRRKEKLILQGVPHVCTISKELPAITDAIDSLLKDL